jgi:glycosyltransferase involved in cell wall biosynthesis
MSHHMRIAWFSPLPPARTGISDYSAAVLPLLDAAGLQIDRFEERNAHDFVWQHRRAPYDLVVYQLGNAPWHDFMWGYLFRYPGLVVLHDARLHHARALQLLRARRVDDYRREFAWNHPDAAPAAAALVAEGLGGPALYLWPMTRGVIDSARVVAVHNTFVADELRARHPQARIEQIRLGTADRQPSPGAREQIRRHLNIPADSIVFVLFGLVTAEKRIEPILGALGALTARGVNAHLLVVGAADLQGLDGLIAAHGVAGRVHVTGYVDGDRIADYLSAGDVSLSLRWPTAEETSASWIDSLAASKATIVTALPHTADIPALDATTWRPTRRSAPPIAVSIDLLDEQAALLAAMSRLAEDGTLRNRLGNAGREYWKAHHQISLTASDYQRVIAQAAGTPAPAQAGLPAHLTNDHSSLATSIAREIGVDLR